MKTKNIVFISLSLMVVGAFMLAVGLISGGQRSLAWKNGFHVVRSELRIQEVSNKVRNLEIDATNMQVTIQRGETFSIESSVLNLTEIKTDGNGDTLSITAHGQGVMTIVSLAGQSSGDYESMLITVPYNINLKTVNVKASGWSMRNEVVINDMQIDELKATMNSNLLQIMNSQIKNLALSSLGGGQVSLESTTISGKVSGIFSGEFSANDSTIEEMALRVNNGSVNLEHTTLNKASELDIEFGNLQLIQAKLAGLDISGRDTIIRHVGAEPKINDNGEEESQEELPFRQGDSKNALVVTMRDSQVWLDMDEIK